MPYPIAHTLVGIAFAKKTDVPFLLAVILANLPDIDYFFGVFEDNLLTYHDYGVAVAHTPWLGAIAMLLYILICTFLKIRYTVRSILGVFLVVLSHVILDRGLIHLPYRINYDGGTEGIVGFLRAFIVNPDFIYNNLLDLAVYGSIYFVIVKFIFKAPLSPFTTKFKK